MAAIRRRQYAAIAQAAGTLGQCLTVTLVLLASLPAVAVSGSTAAGQPMIRMQAADVLSNASLQLNDVPAALSVAQTVLGCRMAVQASTGCYSADTQQGFTVTCAPVRGP